MKLYLDIETYSENPIKSGVYKYAEKAKILLFAYAFDEAPINVIDCSDGIQKIKELFKNLDFKETVFCAHNSNFDRVILEHHLGKLNASWDDTMIKAYEHSLPGSLAMLGSIFKLSEDKQKEKTGKSLIQLFCKPGKDGKINNKNSHPDQWKQFIAYAGRDIETMRTLDKLLPSVNWESDLWDLDQKINDRGFLIDVDLAEKAIYAVEQEKVTLDARTCELTGGSVETANRRDALLKSLLEIYGVSLPDLQISTLTRRLDDETLPEPVRELILLRLQTSGTATKKYRTILDSVCKDGRMRGALQFCGASRTGRWSGRIFQPQNLPRPSLSSEEVDSAIIAIKNNCVDLLYENVKATTTSCIRSLIIAPEGKKLCVSDLSSIEGRVLAWLAGEEWKLKAYRDYDSGSGYDMYTLTYANTFLKAPELVTKYERQLGKVLELALGYGGGVGAFMTFARGYNIDLAEMANRIALPNEIYNSALNFWEYCKENRKTLGLEKEIFIACDGMKRMWRNSNAMIDSLWKTVEYDFKLSISSGIATERKRYTTSRAKAWSRIKLPSGRYLNYPGAKIELDKISYLGNNIYTKKWEYIGTHGGKLVENMTQAVARDILANGIQLCEKNNYPVILHVHDEIITEVEDNEAFTHDKLSEYMSTVPNWAKGLPLAAKGFETYRYRKD